jgi:immune inhibitor A
MNKKYFLAIALVIVGKFAMSQCVAAFAFYQPSNDTTNFVSTSTAGSSNLLYNWNFGDHSVDSLSSLRNPKHFFVTKCKKYNVCLTITDTANYCINTICDTVYVTSPSMVANFTYVNSGVTVNATNTSTGNYANSTWDFGDGTVITQLNALHNYASTYMKDSVTLTVKNIYGCTSSTKKYIYTGCKDSFLYAMTGTSTIDSFTFTPWSNQAISSYTWTING